MFNVRRLIHLVIPLNKISFFTFYNWPNLNKISALSQLIEKCEYTQIKHVHNLIEPKLKRDYITELPREVSLSISLQLLSNLFFSLKKGSINYFKLFTS